MSYRTLTNEIEFSNKTLTFISEDVQKWKGGSWSRSKFSPNLLNFTPFHINSLLYTDPTDTWVFSIRIGLGISFKILSLLGTHPSLFLSLSGLLDILLSVKSCPRGYPSIFISFFGNLNVSLGTVWNWNHFLTSPSFLHLWHYSPSQFFTLVLRRECYVTRYNPVDSLSLQFDPKLSFSRNIIDLLVTISVTVSSQYNLFRSPIRFSDFFILQYPYFSPSLSKILNPPLPFWSIK